MPISSLIDSRPFGRVASPSHLQTRNSNRRRCCCCGWLVDRQRRRTRSTWEDTTRNSGRFRWLLFQPGCRATQHRPPLPSNRIMSAPTWRYVTNRLRFHQPPPEKDKRGERDTHVKRGTGRGAADQMTQSEIIGSVAMLIRRRMAPQLLRV